MSATPTSTIMLGVLCTTYEFYIHIYTCMYIYVQYILSHKNVCTNKCIHTGIILDGNLGRQQILFASVIQHKNANDTIRNEATWVL